MSTFNLDMTTDQIVAEFYIEGTTGGAAVGNIAVLNLDGNVGNVLRGDGTWGTGGSGGGSANVAGANGQLQYNDGGNLGAITGITTNGVRLNVNGVANLHMTGGSNGQMLTTDGSGNLSFQTVPGYVNLPRVDLVSPTGFTMYPSWTEPSFAYYSNISQMNIFVSGVLSDPSLFSLVGTTLTYTFGGMLDTTGVTVLPQAMPIANVDMTGNINAFDITCNTITGDGSGLTNLPGGAFIANGTTSVTTFSTGRVDINIDGGDIVAIDANGMEVNGDLVPAANIIYDLGRADRRWKDLYLSNNTIYLNDVSLSADANGLSVGGSTMATEGFVANAITDLALGNVSKLNLDGNVSNVLSGNGTYVQLNAAPGNTTEVLFNSGGNVSSSNRVSYNGVTLTASSDTSGAIHSVKYSNTSSSTYAAFRARGTKAAPANVAVNDSVTMSAGTFYTGNGTSTIDGLAGWATTASGVSAQVTALPSAAGLPPTTRISLAPTVNTSNTAISTFSTSYAETRILGNTILSPVYADSTTQKYVPASATSSGTTGQIAWDQTYIYICVNTNTWQRVQHATW